MTCHSVKTIVFIPYALKDKDHYTGIVREKFTKLGKGQADCVLHVVIPET